MKEFLDDLEALLIKHPDIEIMTDTSDSRIIFKQTVSAPHFLHTQWHKITLEDIQSFKRELGANNA